MGKVIMNQLINELYSKLDNQEKIIRTLQQKINELDTFQTNRTEYEIRKDQTKKVFDVLAEMINGGGGSYRYLIYDELGFMDGYVDLISGLAITNAICELEECRNLRNYLKQKIKECDDYVKHISQEVRQLKYRTSGKTFLANEIMKSTIAKKTYEEILERMDCE